MWLCHDGAECTRVEDAGALKSNQRAYFSQHLDSLLIINVHPSTSRSTSPLMFLSALDSHKTTAVELIKVHVGFFPA